MPFRVYKVILALLPLSFKAEPHSQIFRFDIKLVTSLSPETREHFKNTNSSSIKGIFPVDIKIPPMIAKTRLSENHIFAINDYYLIANIIYNIINKQFQCELSFKNVRSKDIIIRKIYSSARPRYDLVCILSDLCILLVLVLLKLGLWF